MKPVTKEIKLKVYEILKGCSPELVRDVEDTLRMEKGDLEWEELKAMGVVDRIMYGK